MGVPGGASCSVTSALPLVAGADRRRVVGVVAPPLHFFDGLGLSASDGLIRRYASPSCFQRCTMRLKFDFRWGAFLGPSWT